MCVLGYMRALCIRDHTCLLVCLQAYSRKLVSTFRRPRVNAGVPADMFSFELVSEREGEEQLLRELFIRIVG